MDFNYIKKAARNVSNIRMDADNKFELKYVGVKSNIAYYENGNHFQINSDLRKYMNSDFYAMAVTPEISILRLQPSSFSNILFFKKHHWGQLSVPNPISKHIHNLSNTDFDKYIYYFDCELMTDNTGYYYLEVNLSHWTSKSPRYSRPRRDKQEIA